MNMATWEWIEHYPEITLFELAGDISPVVSNGSWAELRHIWGEEIYITY